MAETLFKSKSMNTCYYLGWNSKTVSLFGIISASDMDFKLSKCRNHGRVSTIKKGTYLWERDNINFIPQITREIKLMQQHKVKNY